MELWYRSGILDEKQKTEILGMYAARPIGFINVLLIVAAVSIGLGVISLVAANWQNIRKLYRLALIVTLYGGGVTAACKMRRNRGISTALMFSSSLIFGAGIFLIGQMYHLGGSLENAFGLWSLGVFPAGFLLKDRFQMMLAQVLMLGFTGIFPSQLMGVPQPDVSKLIIAGGAVAVSWCGFFRVKSFPVFDLAMLLSVSFVTSCVGNYLCIPYMMCMTALLSLCCIYAPLPLESRIRERAVVWGILILAVSGVLLTYTDAWREVFTGRKAVTAAFLAGGLAFVVGIERLTRDYISAVWLIGALTVRVFADTFFTYLSKATGFISLGILCIFCALVISRSRGKRRKNNEQ